MFFSAFERKISWRYLRSRRKEGFISIIAGFSLLGIALGVATLIVVMSVMNGFRQELLTRVLGLNGHFSLYADQGPIYDYQAYVTRLKKVPSLQGAYPAIEAQALVSLNGAASGAMIRGVRPEDLKIRPVLSTSIKQGTLDNFSGDSIAIGQRMADRLGLNIGDALTLIGPRGSITAFGTAPRIGSFKVAAIFDVGMFEYDNNFIFMPLDAAARFFRLVPNAATGIEIFVAHPEDPTLSFKALSDAGGPNTRLVDWQASNRSFFTAIQVERNVMFLILTMIILVAAFNIISSLIMLVKDKSQDIAILRTIGASRASVMRVFLLTGASIGIAGTFLGVLLGVSFALNIETIRQFFQHLSGTDLFSAEIYFLSKLPAIIDWHEVLQVVGMALVLSFAATIYPAWRASSLDPVEALRYE